MVATASQPAIDGAVEVQYIRRHGGNFFLVCWNYDVVVDLVEDDDLGGLSGDGDFSPFNGGGESLQAASCSGLVEEGGAAPQPLFR